MVVAGCGEYSVLGLQRPSAVSGQQHLPEAWLPSLQDLQRPSSLLPEDWPYSWSLAALSSGPSEALLSCCLVAISWSLAALSTGPSEALLSCCLVAVFWSLAAARLDLSLSLRVRKRISRSSGASLEPFLALFSTLSLASLLMHPFCHISCSIIFAELELMNNELGHVPERTNYIHT